MLSSAKSEICKAIYDRLSVITYNGSAIPVFVDIASKAIGNDTLLLIYGYTDVAGGTKLRWGFNCSVNVEVRTESDDMVKHSSVVNSVKGAMHTKLNDTLEMDSFTNIVLKHPDEMQLVDLENTGQILRTLLRYELIVEQINT